MADFMLRATGDSRDVDTQAEACEFWQVLAEQVPTDCVN